MGNITSTNKKPFGKYSTQWLVNRILSTLNTETRRLVKEGLLPDDFAADPDTARAIKRNVRIRLFSLTGVALRKHA